MNIEDKIIEENEFIKFLPNSIDEISFENIESINKNKQLGLIEIEMEQFNEDVSLIYNKRGLKSLKKYLLNPLKKEQAYSLLKSINSGLSMQSYILDKGIVSLETNHIFIKEINNIPYVYFLYIPLNKSYVQDAEEVKKLIFSIIISLADDDLRNEALGHYSDGKGMEELLSLLKCEGIKTINIEEHIKEEPVYKAESVFKPEVKEVKHDETGCTMEFHHSEEEDTSLIDSFEETTLISDDEYYIEEPAGRLLVNNEGVFKEEPIIKDITHIGRGRLSDIVVSNKVVSKKHAYITKSGRDFYLSDEGSRNGTFVNEKRLSANEKIKLKNKDKIKLGNVIISFQK